MFDAVIAKPSSGDIQADLISFTESRPGTLADTFFTKRNSTKTAIKLNVDSPTKLEGASFMGNRRYKTSSKKAGYLQTRKLSLQVSEQPSAKLTNEASKLLDDIKIAFAT